MELSRGTSLERWQKPLSDGSVAVGVVNMSSSPSQAVIDMRDLSLKGKVTRARDLWGHKDVKFNDDRYAANVPAHGVLMLRVWSR
jgi:alpha-galactosidase